MDDERPAKDESLMQDGELTLRVDRQNASLGDLANDRPPIAAMTVEGARRAGRASLSVEARRSDLALKAAPLDARRAELSENGPDAALVERAARVRAGRATSETNAPESAEPDRADGPRRPPSPAVGADDATDEPDAIPTLGSGRLRVGVGQRIRDALAAPVSSQLASEAASLAEPGVRRDDDAVAEARAFTSPDRARRVVGRAASRKLARHDKKWRKQATKAEAHRAKHHKLRAMRSERKARKAARNADKWMAVRHRTTIRGSLSMLLKIALPVVLATCLALCMLVGLAMCSAVQRRGTWSELSASENAVALYLLAHELDETHTAAIMGNMRWESGGNVGDEYRTGSVEAGSGAGHGLCQWSFGRWAKLEEYAGAIHRPWTDINVQLDYLWTEYSNDPVASPYASYQWSTDVYTGETYNHEDFEAENDLHECVRRFRAHFERADAALAHDDKRIEHAERYFAILMSSPDGVGGLGQDYASATAAQRNVVNSAYATPFAGDGLCATWITYSFATAGLPAPGGNACDMARAWWCSSTNRDDLKVGMVVAVESSPYGIGQIYGHVGLYIGDNKVMHNSSSLMGNAPNGCQISDLDDWIAEYEFGCKARWGWALGVNLEEG